jgi:hypothetical protein
VLSGWVYGIFLRVWFDSVLNKDINATVHVTPLYFPFALQAYTTLGVLLACIVFQYFDYMIDQILFPPPKGLYSRGPGSLFAM